MAGKSIERSEFLRVNIDLPAVQMQLNTKNPLQGLTELRRILEALRLDDEVMYEEFVTEEIRHAFSDTFIKNEKCMAVVKKLLKQEDDYRLATTEVSTSAMLDLRNNTKTVKVKQLDVKRAVSGMTSSIDGNCVKHGIVHINGQIEDDDKLLVVDHIHKFMPTAQLRAFHSTGKTGKITIECIFFGDFPQEE